MSRRQISDLWYHIAKLRQAKGDKAGAKRARKIARIYRDRRIR